MAEKESFFWRWIWDAPLLGEIIQLIVLLFPIGVIGLTGVLQDTPDSDGLLLVFALLEIGWLWILERAARRRFVLPIIPVPWLWIFVVFAGYCLLAMFGIVESA